MTLVGPVFSKLSNRFHVTFIDLKSLVNMFSSFPFSFVFAGLNLASLWLWPAFGPCEHGLITLPIGCYKCPTHTTVMFFLQKFVRVWGAAEGRTFEFVYSKMLKIHLHLNVVVKSTYKINGARFKGYSCTPSSLKIMWVPCYWELYLHIYFQSINAAFKTDALAFLLTITPAYQRHSK